MPKQGKAYFIKFNFCVEAFIDLLFYKRRDLVFENKWSGEGQAKQSEQTYASDLKGFFYHRCKDYWMIQSSKSETEIATAALFY